MQYREYTFEMKNGEYWYGSIADHGVVYPLHSESVYEADVAYYTGDNQINTLLISTKGRVIWCETGFRLSVADGEIKVESCKGVPEIYELGSNLKEAFVGAAQRFFPANGVVPPKEFFVKPQYNTWIELIYNQNQQDIMDYVDKVVEKDMPVGIIMIDDSWSEYYGRWEFNRGRFPDPKAMVDHLHELGFRVMLWICPFVSPDSLEFRELREKGYLVRDKEGKVAIREWWNGFSGVLDLTNPGAMQWLHDQNKHLMDAYGIDGFKFDAGDSRYYREDDITYAPTDGNGQSELWAKAGLAYEYNEYRACYKMAGTHLVQRLADKSHRWYGNGLNSLMPNQLAQGILGYAYTCPDMIGGGGYTDFLGDSKNLDQELFVRYAQCAALMPMMQFSAAPWRVLDQTHFECCQSAAWLHVKYADYIYQLAQQSSQTGEPIVRYMTYEFPDEGLEQITDQFMLGDRYLVAPVIQKGATSRTVHFPTGKWLGDDESIVQGPCEVAIEVPLYRLPVYEKLEK